MREVVREDCRIARKVVGSLGGMVSLDGMRWGGDVVCWLWSCCRMSWCIARWSRLVRERWVRLVRACRLI